MTERIIATGTQRRETASVLAQSLLARFVTRVRRSEPARLQPTIFVAVRRGEEPDWKSVVARSV